MTDGASNMKASVLFLALKWLYTCVAHMLNRAVQVGFEETALRISLLKPAKVLARYFRSSPKAGREVSEDFMARKKN